MKRVVMMVIDGLRSDTPLEGWMPSLSRVREASLWYRAHRGVFPSATRVSSASIATGCWPGNHGLAGNSVALPEGDGYTVVSAGTAEFAGRYRAARGRVLDVPTMADRLAERMLVVSNSSAGAAHMQDPNKQCRFFHRSGSWAPGGASVPAGEGLEVTYDSTGDAITAQRFCEALLYEPAAALSLLWICEPDHSQHHLSLGGPDHRAVLAGSDRLVAQVAHTVARLRARGDEVMFVIASDHGQETTDEIIDVSGALVAAGYKDAPDSSDLVVASSGMGGLLYANASRAQQAGAMAAWLRAQPWCEAAWSGNSLAEIGQRARDGVIVAFAMARRDAVNEHGVPGLAHTIKDPFMPGDGSGQGQHGGLGPYEGSPMLMLQAPGISPGVTDASSSLVDIAPTVLRFLGEADGGMDGAALH